MNFMSYNCSICQVEILKKVYDYSKTNYGKALCRNCQEMSKKKSKKEKIVKIKNSKNKEESSGLSKNESRYKEGMIKGRIAETLIEELFLSLGYNVFRYGMENTVPGVVRLLKDVRGDVADNIRRMPDFVIQNPNTNQVYFIEVKFRKDGNFDKNDKTIKDYPYENAYFIVVSKKHIKCITYKELQEEKEVNANSRNYLGNRKEFELDKKTIIDFCDFAKKFFECV